MHAAASRKRCDFDAALRAAERHYQDEKPRAPLMIYVDGKAVPVADLANAGYQNQVDASPESVAIKRPLAACTVDSITETPEGTFVRVNITPILTAAFALFAPPLKNKT